METSRQQEHQLRRMGREAVTKAIQAANANSGGMRRVTAKVTRVNSDYTVDVDMGDSAYSMPITGLRYTTSCFGVRVGDTVLVDVVGHLATVTGILATADSGPYVRLYKEGAYGFCDYRVVGGVAVCITCDWLSTTANTAKELGTLPSGLRPKASAMGAGYIRGYGGIGQISVDSDGLVSVWCNTTNDGYFGASVTFPLP